MMIYSFEMHLLLNWTLTRKCFCLTRDWSCWWLETSRRVCPSPAWYIPTGCDWCPGPVYYCSPQTYPGMAFRCWLAPWWWSLPRCSWTDRRTDDLDCGAKLGRQIWSENAQCRLTLQTGRWRARVPAESRCSLASTFYQRTRWWEPEDVPHRSRPEICICHHTHTKQHVHLDI